MRNPKLKIGILGGIGAMASENFLKRFLQSYIEVTNAKHDCDFPEILYYNTYLSNFSEKGILDEFAIKKQLKQKLEFFKENKCDIVLVVCISVMHILKKIKLSKNIRLINLVDITNDYLNEKKFSDKNILILSSHSTRNKKLFESNNCSLIYANFSEQKRVNELIFSAMSGNTTDDNFIQQLVECYKPDYVLLGCTELPLILPNNKVEFIDPLNLAINIVLNLIKKPTLQK